MIQSTSLGRQGLAHRRISRLANRRLPRSPARPARSSACATDAAPELPEAGNLLSRPSLVSAAAAVSVAPWLPPLHALIAFYPWPFYFMMAFKPDADRTKQLLQSAKALIPFAVLYAVLLAVSWTPESFGQLLPGSVEQGMKNAKAGKVSAEFMPTVESVGQLLSRPLASLSAWAHLQFVSFFCARWIWMDGLVKDVKTTHSVLLCALLAPLGFLSHVITTFLSRGGASSSSANASSSGAGFSGVASRSSTAGVTRPSRPAGGAFRSRDDDGSESSSSQGSAASTKPDAEGKGGSLAARVAALTSTDAGDSEAGDGSQGGRADQNGGGAQSGSTKRGGGGFFGGRSKNAPDWLTVDEPVYVDRK